MRTRLTEKYLLRADGFNDVRFQRRLSLMIRVGVEAVMNKGMDLKCFTKKISSEIRGAFETTTNGVQYERLAAVVSPSTTISECPRAFNINSHSETAKYACNFFAVLSRRFHFFSSP